MTLEPGTPIGKYVVRRKLAEGGMAEIYLCYQRGPEGFEKDVVIKRIRPFLATEPGFVQMFIAEARVASRLNHPNLVQIFDFDKHEDTYFLAMEYVRGHSLQEARRRAKERMERFSPTLVAHVGTEVARGLGYAHGLTDRGRPLHLVHRDVTPHNVLLSFDGAVKLTDFGIAKAGNKLTVPGTLKGKFAYMSPEQSRGEDVDARTDVFALGIVLWEMLTGGRLFDGDSDVAVLRAVQSSVIPPPARLNPDVPAALDAVVMRALERDPARRFQTAEELGQALARFVFEHAEQLEDTSVSSFLRGLYAEELAEQDWNPTDLSVLPPGPGSRRTPSPVRTPGSPASWDEDAHAETFVLSGSASASADEAERETVRPAGGGGTAVLPARGARGASGGEQPASDTGGPARAEGTPVFLSSPDGPRALRAEFPGGTDAAPDSGGLEPREHGGEAERGVDLSRTTARGGAREGVGPELGGGFEVAPLPLPSLAEVSGPRFDLGMPSQPGSAPAASRRRTWLWGAGAAVLFVPLVLFAVWLPGRRTDTASPPGAVAGPPLAVALPGGASPGQTRATSEMSPRAPSEQVLDEQELLEEAGLAPADDTAAPPAPRGGAEGPSGAGASAARPADPSASELPTAAAPTASAAGERPKSGTTARASPGPRKILEALPGAPLPEGRALLRIKATPWADVLVGGVKLRSVEGTKLLWVLPGSYRIRFEHRGSKLTTREERVTLQAGEEASREFVLAL